MECTQRLECTQDLYGTQSERICPEQIGFLGICGHKYPVIRGPNKIGRDPQTCSIVLNLNSVSRQHAVLNILNKKDFMLMDLDSANKTKLSGKSIQPYIPQPIHDGDTVQFGEIFGVFRLLEEDNELPMTQALDIPDTPVQTKYVSRVNAVTTIPESPDVSDRDDSFIVPSQPKGYQLKSSKTQHYVKPGKTISIQPIGSNKIDNIYWNSSKKSTSFNLDDSDKSLNDSLLSVRLKEKENIDTNDIHEMETQKVLAGNMDEDSPDSIYSANTQIPENGLSIHAANTQMPGASGSPSIHNMNTQLPSGTSSPSIHSLNTQMPAFGSPSIDTLDTQLPGVLPEVCKINEQQDVQFDLCAKENDVYDVDTEDYVFDNENVSGPNPGSSKNSILNKSNEEVLFEEVDNGPEYELESQAILTEDIDLPINKFVEEPEPLSQIAKPKCAKRNMRIQSEESTDCEDIDILPTQVIPVKKTDEDDTDCEDVVDAKSPEKTDEISKATKGDDDDDDQATQDLDFDYYNNPPPKTTFNKQQSPGNIPTQVPNVDKIDNVPVVDQTPVELNTLQSKKTKEVDFDDMPTQVLDFDNENITSVKPVPINNKDTNVSLKPNEIDFEDMATQVLENENVENVSNVNQSPVKKHSNTLTNPNEIDFENMATQVLETDNVEKTPVAKNKSKIEVPKPNADFEDLPTQVLEEDVTNKTYKENQFSEEIVSPFKVPSSAQKGKKKEKLILKPISKLVKSVANDINYYENTQEVLDDLCTQRIGSPELKPKTKESPKNVKSPKPYDEEVNKFVSKLSAQEIKEVIGVSSPVAKPIKVPSDGSTSSDLEVTPKKSRLFKVMNTDLPNSQEIKTGVSFCSKSQVTESSSDSEAEVKKEEEHATPLVHRRSKKKSSAVNNVTKKLEVESLPTRILTRPRKPTAKFQEAQGNASNILKPKYLMEQECELDEEIITENIARLKNEQEKSKLNKSRKECNQNDKQDNKAKDLKSEPVKKERASKKSEKEIIEKSDNKDVSKDKKRNKKEPNNNKKESRNSKNSDIVDLTKQLDSTVELSNITSSSIRSIESEIIPLDTISPMRTRSRGARSTKNTKIGDKSTKSSKTSSPERQDKRKRTKKAEHRSPSPTKEVRRSRRQKTKEEPVIKSILKNAKGTLEQSAVYNNSGSNSESPRSLKRPALDESDEPSSKRTRQSNVSLRATPARTARTQYVLFTAFPVEEVKVKLEKMGAVVVTDVMKCTMLLTLQIKRTFKLLCAVGLGKPIVGPDWVQACADTNTIVDPWLYIIGDEVAEKRFHFSLQQTLVGRRNFLQGYNVSSTPSVMPNQTEMKLIVECSGGKWQEGGTKWLCVTSSSDKHLWPALNKLGATLVTTELILGGVLRQKLDVESNRVHF